MFKNRFFTFWYPVRNPERDITEISYINMLISVGYCYSLLMFGYLLWNLAAGTDNAIMFLHIASILFMLGTIKYSKSYRIPASIFLIMCIFHGILLLLRFADFPYTIMFWSPVFVVVAVYLFGKINGAIWSIIAVTLTSVALKWGYKIGFTVVPVDPGIHKDLAIYSQIICILASYGSSILFTNHISRLHLALQNQHIKLQEQLAITRHQNEAIQGLVSVVCHDIGSPLTVILMSAGIAVEKCKDEFQKKMWERVTNVSLSIDSIIKTVKQYHQIETGKLVLQLESVDLVRVFNGLNDIFQERLLAKNLSLELDVDPNGVYRVVGNESVLLHNVLSNLVSNAIKFSDPGSKIILKLEEKDGAVQVRVTDFGIGIPPGLINDLFKIDKPTSRRGTSGEKGTGFGLPIVKSFIDRFGGSIEVNSHPKIESDPQALSSTTFVVSLKKCA